MVIIFQLIGFSLLLIVFNFLWLNYQNRFRDIQDSTHRTELFKFIQFGLFEAMTHKKWLIGTIPLGVLVLLLFEGQFSKVSLFLGVLFVSGVVVSHLIGVLVMHLMTRFYSNELKFLSVSLSHFYSVMKARGSFIVAIIIGCIILDVFVFWFLIDTLSHLSFFDSMMQSSTDIFNFSSHLGSMMVDDCLNRKFIGFIYTVHAFGFIVQSILNRMFSSFYGVSSDVAADLSAHIDYNLFEDDLRNPAVMADLVGDTLKKGYSIIDISVCLMIVLSSFSFLYSTCVSGTPFLNHMSDHMVFIFFLAAGFFILAVQFIPESLNDSQPLLGAKHITYHLKGVGLVSVVMGLLIIFLDGSPLVFSQILLGMITFVGLVWATFYLLKDSHQLQSRYSIFELLSKGATRGVVLVISSAFICFVGLFLVFFLGNIFDAAYSKTHYWIYFILGFTIQLLFLLVDYIAFSMSDTIYAICRMLNDQSTFNDSIQVMRRYTISISTILKIGIAFIGFNLSFLLIDYFFFTLRLEMVIMGQFKSMQLANGADIFTMFNIFPNQLEFVMGFFTGVIGIILSLGVLGFGFYRIYVFIQDHLKVQFEQPVDDMKSDVLPDYNQLNAAVGRLSKKWASICFAVLLLFPFIPAALFGVNGLVGFVLACIPIALVIDLIGVSVGSYWSIVKSESEKKDGLDYEHDDYAMQTNTIFCDSLGDVGKDLLGSTLTIILLGFIFISILVIPLALLFDYFITL